MTRFLGINVDYFADAFQFPEEPLHRDANPGLANAPQQQPTQQHGQVYQGVSPDDYVSAFAGYHALWYDDWKESCKAAWHTHVDFAITLENATNAIKFQLEELIKWLDTH